MNQLHVTAQLSLNMCVCVVVMLCTAACSFSCVHPNILELDNGLFQIQDSTYKPITRINYKKRLIGLCC